VTDFHALIRLLVESKIEFIVIGGAAATAHGSARLTVDLEVVYRHSSDNISRLVAALNPLNPYLRGAPAGLPFDWSEETVRKGLNFTLDTSLGALDLLGEVTGGGDYEALLDHTISLEVAGVECLCLDLPRLIQVKRAAGRPKDFDAIAELEIIQDERHESQ
jgi:hypothetical protein